MLTFNKAMPEEAGIPSECIIRFIERLEKRQIPMHSFLIMRRDLLIAEGYYSPCGPESLHRMFSITKSLTALAVGLLADEGRISLEDPICQYFPEKLPPDPHPWIMAMTIRDMLMMRTCHASTTYKLDMDSDWVESFFTTAPTHPSGRIFHYDTSSAHTLCALVEKLTGQDMLDYLKDKLAPLGLSEASYLLKDPFGVSIGGSGLVATSLDLLKIGYFLSHRGQIEGRKLLSPSYIDSAVSCLSATCVTAPLPSEAQGYGFQIWRNERDGFVCYGMGGQLIIVLPAHELICVTTADTQGIGGGNQQIYDALYEEILPFLSSEALPAAPEKDRTLKERLASLSMKPLCGAYDSPLTEIVTGKCYHPADLSLGFESIALSFTKNPDSQNTVGTLSFSLNGINQSLSFGLGHIVWTKFPGYELNCAASAAWLSDNTLYIRADIIDSYVGSVHFQLAFGEDDLTVFMRKKEESLFKEYDGHLYCTI